LIAFLTLSIAEAKAPSTQITTEITDLNKSTNSVLVAIPQVPSVPKTRNCESYRSLVEQYDWNIDIAMAIMKAESGCNPTVTNWQDHHKGCSGSTGLFQVGCINAPREQMEDPVKNIAKSYQLYSSRGWQPWGAYTNGSYLKHI